MDVLEILLSVVGIAVTVVGIFVGWKTIRRSPPEPEPLMQRNRRRMLERVRQFWIEGVLEQSLYQEVARIELGLLQSPKTVEHPWRLVAQQPGRDDPQPLPDGMPMQEVFAQFDKTLLLLGAPGSGKTTLLLELARDLIERAQEDPDHPIPVVFNLSSWTLRHPSLEAWLVDELSKRYDVPRKLGKHWIEKEEVLPLLNGLDEVTLEHRPACVQAINAFRERHGLLPLAVCSRVADLETLTVRLRLPGAVTIQPLKRPQVEEYLRQAGKALSGVDTALRQDGSLWELLNTPLILSILALAYQGQKPADVRIAGFKGTLEARRAVLFDAYIEAMFERRATPAPHTPERTRHWLSWLARTMVRYDQTVFYLEHMQPDWLPKAHRWLPRIGFGLIAGLIYGLIGGLVFGLGGGLLPGIAPVETLQWSWKEGVVGSLRGLLKGLVVGLIFGLTLELVGVLMFGLIAGLVAGLRFGGMAYIRHYVLRLLLWRYDYAPLRYVHFLDYAADRLFLRKVGGGYIFVHRMLTEHFAGLKLQPEEAEVTTTDISEARRLG